jgi:quercetin dioxygenase-like cupin family protein
MAQPGDVLEHPRGDRLEFVTTAASSGGALLEMRATYPARTAAPVLHLHPEQEETFTVVQGALRTVIGGTEQRYVAGSTFVVPSGTPHTMHADSDEPTHFLWQVRPALRTESFFETMWALARADGSTEWRRPNPLDGASLMRAYAREFRLVRPPRWVQVPLFAVLAAFANLRPRR